MSQISKGGQTFNKSDPDGRRLLHEEISPSCWGLDWVELEMTEGEEEGPDLVS